MHEGVRQKTTIRTSEDPGYSHRDELRQAISSRPMR